MKRKIFIGLFLISISIFAEEKYRGVDVLNFYIPIEERNKIYTSIDYERKNDKDIYQWKIAEGYLEINNLWDFEFNVEKEFHRQKRPSRKNYSGWDNKFSLVRNVKGNRFFNKEWSNDLVMGLEQNQIDDKGFETERYKLFAGYRTRTSLNLGMGGTYFGFDLIGKKVFSREKDGWSGEFDIVSTTNMGYGFQLFNTLYNEYLYYDTYSGTYRLGLESYIRWTYELGESWAFALSSGIDGDKYFKNTNDDYNFEAYIYPHLLFNYNLSDQLRVVGELGLPAYKWTRDRASDYRNFRSRTYFYSKAGIEYIF